MIREIVTYDINRKDNPAILQKKLREVTDFDAQETKDCIQDLNDSLDDLIRKEGNKRGAIGLSACQIGYDLAISTVTLGDKRYDFVNPKLIAENGKQRLFRIGCFSLYQYRAMVRYNDDVVISYFDKDGNQKELSLQGDRSCVVQHEMDHLQGDLLFERLEHKKEDLFIPRESLYKDGKIPLKNQGLIFELRRRLGLNKAMDAPTYYSSLFNDYSDYVSLVDKTEKEKEDLLNTVIEETPEKGKILEIDDSTSCLSVSLNKKGYETQAVILDEDMKDLDERINAANRTNVKYHSSSEPLPFEDKAFDTAFSYGILESLDEKDFVRKIKEILRTAKCFIIEVPLINISSNALRGNERLRNVNSYRKIFSTNGLNIEKKKEKDGKAIFVIR